MLNVVFYIVMLSVIMVNCCYADCHCGTLLEILITPLYNKYAECHGANVCHAVFQLSLVS